jgi:hypothetical protein
MLKTFALMFSTVIAAQTFAQQNSFQQMCELEMIQVGHPPHFAKMQCRIRTFETISEWHCARGFLKNRYLVAVAHAECRAAKNLPEPNGICVGAFTERNFPARAAVAECQKVQFQNTGEAQCVAAHILAGAGVDYGLFHCRRR